MVYDKACYERRKRLVIKKSDGEEFVAYREIREKWGLDDFQIKSLLSTNTLTEIMGGEMVGGKLMPKELIRLDRLMIFALIVLFSVFLAVCAHGNEHVYQPILSFSGDK